MPDIGDCPCGLRVECPYGITSTTEPLNCPVWNRHVRPGLRDRITGFFVALFQWW